ncbi:hypothetical protein NW767_015548 [Fusarium falciforme]|nr:hypothetical protein NW767_015548 [Fusarium falciforme]
MGEVYEDSDPSDTAPEGPPLKRRKISQIRPVVDTDSGDVNIRADALTVKGYFSECWAYEPPIDSKPGKTPIGLVSWTDHDLDMHPGKPGLKHFDGPPGTVRSRWELHSRISSHLLLFRLYVAFGAPYSSSEVELDPLKQVWGYKLYWMPLLECTEEGQSSLTLEDWKGSCKLRFWGSEEASRSALRLAEWLVSDNVAHPCDYALAGTAA